MARMALNILFLQGAWLAAPSDEACSIQSQSAEETSFLTLKGDVTEDLWTACTVTDGHKVCTEFPPLLFHKVRENKIKFTSKKGHAQLTGVDFDPVQYSVTDGQPVNEICLRKDHKELQFYAGRHKSSKPGIP